YAKEKQKNQFTKVQMNLEADKILLDYFASNLNAVENWFNVISPKQKKLSELKRDLRALNDKNWKEILK
ncbi:MAG: hypothetical protein LBT56_01200, partial [Prevotellaceae bacterium]|nr:hypothetical protein [Prevotellaceae bacterium]